MHGGLPRKMSHLEMQSGCPLTWLIYRLIQDRRSHDLELKVVNIFSFLAGRESHLSLRQHHGTARLVQEAPIP